MKVKYGYLPGLTIIYYVLLIGYTWPLVTIGVNTYVESLINLQAFNLMLALFIYAPYKAKEIGEELIDWRWYFFFLPFIAAIHLWIKIYKYNKNIKELEQLET